MLKNIKKCFLYVVFMLGGIILLFVLRGKQQIRENAITETED